MGGNPEQSDAGTTREVPPPLPVSVGTVVIEPMPAIPVVEYRTAGARSQEGARPGILTALGIVSICIGLLGLAVHLASMPAVGHMFDVTAPPQTPRMMPPLPPPPAVKPYAGEWRVDTGLGRADREIAVEYLTKRLSLGVDRRVTLRKLLGDAGREIFLTFTSPVTEDAVASRITEAGQLPAGPDGLRSLGTHYFRTSAGTVLLDDNVARFYPGDATPPIRIELGMLVRGTGQPRMCAVQIEEQLDDLRKQFGPRFNATHAAVLGERLSKMNRFSPGFTAFIADPQNLGMRANTKRMLSGDTFEYDAGYPKTWIMANGRVIEGPGPHLDPRTGQAPPPPAPGVRKRAMTRTLAIIAAVGLIVGVALATFLTVCGIMVLANAPSGGRNHARWAWLKLLAVAVFLAPSFATASAMAQDDKGAGAIGFITAVVIIAAAVMLLQLTYPIIVLAVLRSRPVGTYYARLGESVDPTSAETRLTWRRRAASFATTRRGRATTVAALLLLVAAMIAYTTTTWSIEPDGQTAWYASTLARGVMLILAAAAAVLCGIALKRRPAAAAVMVIFFATTSFAAPASRPTTYAEVNSEQPAARRAGGTMTARLPPEQLGRLAEEAIVRRSAGARDRLEAAALAADSPTLARLRERPLRAGFADLVRQALRELGWAGCAEAFREMLSDKDPIVRRQAADVLRGYVDRLAPSWRALVNAARDSKAGDVEANLLQRDRDRYANPVDWTAKPEPADDSSSVIGHASEVDKPRISSIGAWLAPLSVWLTIALSATVFIVATIYATTRRAGDVPLSAGASR